MHAFNHTLPYYLVIEEDSRALVYAVLGECAAGPFDDIDRLTVRSVCAVKLQVGETFRDRFGRVGTAVCRVVDGDVIGLFGCDWENPALRLTKSYETVALLGPLDLGFLACVSRPRVHSGRRGA